MPKEKVSKGGGHFSVHSRAVNLKVVAVIESEVIHGENHADEVADGASRYGVVRIPHTTAHRWLSWLSIGLSCGRSRVRLRSDQHSGS